MTAKIKLNSASGGGSVSIQAPSSSSNNRVISLPDIADGTLVTSQSTLDATKLSGNLPALNGSALTNLPAGGGMTLLNTTTITNNSTSISLSLSSYQHLYGTITGLVGASALSDCYLRFNSDSGTNYIWYREVQNGDEGRATGGDRDATAFYPNGVGFAGWPNSQNVHQFTLFDVNSGARKLFEMFSVGDDPSYSGHPLLIMTKGQYKSTAAITSLQLSGATAFTGGEVKLYGVK